MYRFTDTKGFQSINMIHARQGSCLRTLRFSTNILKQLEIVLNLSKSTRVTVKPTVPLDSLIMHKGTSGMLLIKSLRKESVEVTVRVSQISKLLEVYIVINFRVRKVSQGTHNLAWTSILIKKKKKEKEGECNTNSGSKRCQLSCNYVLAFLSYA